MMKLIVNADDFGMTKGITRGILKAYQEGVLTSTTAMVQGLYFKEAMAEAFDIDFYDIGLHLNITQGKPVCDPKDIPSLVDNRGEFHVFKVGADYLNIKEVEMELEAQIAKFLEVYDQPTHFDGHHHFFNMSEDLQALFVSLGKKYGVPLRTLVLKDTMNQDKLVHRNKRYQLLYEASNIKTTDYFILHFYGDHISEDLLFSEVFKHDDQDTVELMVHPGFYDEDLITVGGGYDKQREVELAVLISEQVKRVFNSRGIELISFRDLQ